MNSFLKSIFFKNLLVLFSGSGLAQLIPILCAPIISRLYTDADYGLLTAFLSIIGPASVLVVSHYVHAIVVADKEKEGIQLYVFSFYNSMVIALVFLFIAIFFKENIDALFLEVDLSNWILFMPLAILLQGLYQTSVQFLNRAGTYRPIAICRIIVSIVSVTTQILWGVYMKNASGLVIGYILGQALGAVILISTILYSRGFGFMKPIKSIIVHSLGKYVKFLKYTMSADFISLLIPQIPVYLMAKSYGASGIGSYGYAQRLLSIPIGLVATSIMEVFRQEARDNITQNGNCKSTFLNTFKLLLLLSFIPFSILGIWAPEIFSFVFGANWRNAGEIAQVLSLMFFFKFSANPLSYIFLLRHKQIEHFLGQLYIVMSSIAIFAIAMEYFPMIQVLLIYSINYSVFYLYQIIRSYQLSK